MDVDLPNVARMYDYLLGGGDNFAADRELVAELVATNLDMARTARANRAFLTRVVRRCVREGIEQFLDLGSGVPTVGNVHDIAHQLNPAARVAYVDVEPVAVAQARDLLRGQDGAGVTLADLRDVPAVFAGAGEVLDLNRPVAVLAVAVLHFLPGDLTEVLAPYRRRLTPGGALAFSHGSPDQDDPELAARVAASFEVYRSSATPPTVRTRRELRAAVADLTVADPGLVDITAWPQPGPDAPVGIYGLLAHRF